MNKRNIINIVLSWPEPWSMYHFLLSTDHSQPEADTTSSPQFSPSKSEATNTCISNIVLKSFFHLQLVFCVLHQLHHQYFFIYLNFRDCSLLDSLENNVVQIQILKTLVMNLKRYLLQLTLDCLQLILNCFQLRLQHLAVFGWFFPQLPEVLHLHLAWFWFTFIISNDGFVEIVVRQHLLCRFCGVLS